MAEMFDVEDAVDPTPEELRRQEISELKRGWASDPCFDIEDTEGFEDVREELLQFRKEVEDLWAKQRIERLSRLAEKLGFKHVGVYDTGISYRLDPEVFTEYMEKMLGNITALEDRLEQTENKLNRLGEATDLRFGRLERGR